MTWDYFATGYARLALVGASVALWLGDFVFAAVLAASACLMLSSAGQ